MNEGAVIVEAPKAGPDAGPAPKRQVLIAALQIAVSFAVLGVVVAVIGHFFHDTLWRAGTTLIDTLGLGGIACGVFLADGFHFPVPPQFYMLAVVAHGGPVVPALLAIGAGTIAGGHAGFFFSRRLTHIAFIRHGTERVARKLAHWFDRYGTRAVIIAAVLPIPYSFLCYLAGLQRLRYRAFAPIVILRLPKILLYFLIVRAGWA